ncbi:hypothetical protein [Christiangramia sabulilitoris]|uniref:Uncharacterized protein n=1 Tax=Christiangramia sabulilitoris TaxID=2583991 RepID=A0A550I7I5_9FLAO|nr:hypothetical protein [Christiangramia sabulilitoris]TRO66936.1 hypothetical protein FGM01_03335 [Christiangramia sabulilitoris]
MNNLKANPNALPVITTGRSEKAINKAAKNGLFPLVKKVEPSKKIRSKYAVFQHKITGEIEVVGDFRADFRDHDEYEKVIDWTWYYPDPFPEPFAAYLIPPDLQAGDKVWLEDLIDDYVGSHWNQGNTYRLKSAEAIWTGKDFKIDYDALRDVCIMVG